MFTTFEQEYWAFQLPKAVMALNNCISQSTSLSPFFMTHGFYQSDLDFAVPPGQGSSLSPAEQGCPLVDKWRNSNNLAKAAMAIAQESEERHSNIRRLVGDELHSRDCVWLRLKHVKTTRPIKRLDWIAHSYRLLACIGTPAVCLDTPPRIHPIFHVSLVQKAGEDPLPFKVTIDNEPGMILDTPADTSSLAMTIDSEYAVDRILWQRRQGRGWQLLVKWIGWPEPAWKPLEHLQETMALNAYEHFL